MASPEPADDFNAAHNVIPHLVCDGASDAIEFYKNAFGAVEMIRLPGPDGRLMHASLSINGGMVMLVDEMLEHDVRGPNRLGGTPVTIHLIVPDVDAFVDRAVKAGATLFKPVADQFWGDRYGIVADPFGHHWSVATPGENAPRTSEALIAAMKG